ncbi:MAG: hypothetical protein PUC09_01620 [Methanobrevibacter wolinii]|nr:hypothetical protein [Methanobrevibacter wolinii]
MFNLPLEITAEDDLQSIFTKYGAYALDKQENLSDFIGEKKGNLDIENGILSFGEDLSFSIQLIAYLSLDDNKFSWAWDNSEIGFPLELIDEAKKIKEFGEEYNIPQFTTPMFNADIEEAHFLLMTVISLFDDSAYYVAEIGNFAFFVTINSEDIPENNTIDRFEFIYYNFQKNYNVNGKIAFEGYAALKGYPTNVYDEDNFQVAIIGEDKIMIGYSKRGNVNLIKTFKPNE